MCGDDEHRCGGLEAHAALDADDRVADVHVAADAVARADGLHGTDRLDLVGIGGAVHGCDLTLLESDGQALLALGRDLARVGLFGERLFRAEGLLAADRGAPQPLVDRILHLLEVGREAVPAQVVDLVFAREGHVARRGDDLDLRSENLERQVEAHLVVARTGRAVGHGVGSDPLGVFDDGNGLEDALGAHRDGVGAVAQHVAEDHVADALLVVLLLDVERGVLHGAELQGPLLDPLQLGFRETARVGNGRIDVISLLLGEVFHTERGVQPAAERQNHFFLFHIAFRFFRCLFLFSGCRLSAAGRLRGAGPSLGSGRRNPARHLPAFRPARSYFRWKTFLNLFFTYIR